MKQITIDIIQSKPSIDVGIVSKKPQIEVEVKQSRPTISVDVLPPTSIENGDYDVLRNKPSINSVQLVGNKTSEELGLADKADVDKLSADFINHIEDYENPHRTTAEQVGAVPVDFRSFRVVEQPTKSFRQSAEVFISKGGNGFRMTLQDVKNMGTKIVIVNDIKEADFDNLDVGDYIYSNI